MASYSHQDYWLPTTQTEALKHFLSTLRFIGLPKWGGLAREVREEGTVARHRDHVSFSAMNYR